MSSRLLGIPLILVGALSLIYPVWAVTDQLSQPALEESTSGATEVWFWLAGGLLAAIGLAILFRDDR